MIATQYGKDLDMTNIDHDTNPDFLKISETEIIGITMEIHESDKNDRSCNKNQDQVSFWECVSQGIAKEALDTLQANGTCAPYAIAFHLPGLQNVTCLSESDEERMEVRENLKKPKIFFFNSKKN